MLLSSLPFLVNINLIVYLSFFIIVLVVVILSEALHLKPIYSLQGK